MTPKTLSSNRPTAISPRRVPILAKTVWLALVCCLPAVMTAHAQISPGPLARAHQSLSGPTQCTSCHALGRGAAALKCQECHTEIAHELAQGRGLHARFQDKENCAKCHSEHNGEDFGLIHWEPSLKNFDHRQTGYALEGKHAGIECGKCHAPAHISAAVRPSIQMKDLRRTFLGLSQQCVSCHDDPHHSQLGQDCVKCHNFTDWKAASKIDHDKTRFPLTGLHAKVECAKCHTPATPKGPPRFTGIPFAKCSDCHTDPHRGAFAQSCESCHTTESWKKISSGRQFDHSKTKYPLEGKHAQVDCIKCHASANFKKPVAFAKCSDCHQPDPHGGQFAARKDRGECSACHTVAGWKPSSFGVKEHASSAYPLEGKHAGVSCDKCHLPAGTATRYKVAFANCKDCHKDVHADQFAQAPYNNRCEQCHSVKGFRPSSYTLAQHQKSRFPLSGGHVAVACGDCHAGGRAGYAEKVAAYHFADRSCTGCHKDPHRDQFKERMAEKRPNGSPFGCEACHTVKSWTDLPGFDHSKTSFPLRGGHAKVACEKCHKPAEPSGKVSEASFRSAPTACSGCHEDVHASQFAKGGQPVACEQCHTEDHWKPSLFNHETQTDFSLRPAHKKVACDDCHSHFRFLGGKQVLVYNLAPRECARCHN